MDMAQLEQRLTRMEDIEAIKQLKARYCAIADEDHNPDKITTLFVEDGIWEGGFGTAQGHAAIRQLFQRAQQRFSFSHHMVLNPIIEVAGNRVKGTWYFFCSLYRAREQRGQVARRALRGRLHQGEWCMEVLASTCARPDECVL